MPVESILDVPRTAMAYERLRLDTASRNIANANVPVAPGQAATRFGVTGSEFGEAATGATTSEQPVAQREVYDPGHPMADAKGMVHFPATDMTQEMTTLLTASRSYEANVRSFNLLRSMMLRALEIGAK